MPTAHEHYAKAERLSDTALDGELLHTPDMRLRLATLAVAHATLALAATNGANQPAHRTQIERTIAEMQQGAEITDQMGGTPDVNDPTDCWRDGCVSDNHDSLGPHVDAEGVEFR